MSDFTITIIFIVLLVSGVYFYAGYLTRTGKAEDADGNLIPDESLYFLIKFIPFAELRGAANTYFQDKKSKK